MFWKSPLTERKAFFGTAFIFSCLFLCIGYFYGSAVFGDLLIGPDSYMRADRILQLMQTKEWYLDKILLITPPDGQVSHWTRPMDAFIILGTLPVLPFVESYQEAILWSSLWMPLCLIFIFVWVLFWAVRPIVTDIRQQILCSVAIFSQLTVSSQFAPGMIDHHAPAFIATALLIGLGFRILTYASTSSYSLFSKEIVGYWVIGFFSVFGIWTNGEVIVPYAATVAALAFVWFLRSSFISGKALAFSVSSFLSGCFFLVLERGLSGIFDGWMEMDRFSVFYCCLLALMTFFWGFAYYCDGLSKEMRHSFFWKTPIFVLLKTGISLLCLGILILFLMYTQPQILHGQTNIVDPLYQEMRLGGIAEAQSVFVGNFTFFESILNFIANAGIIFIGLCLSAFFFLTDSKNRFVWSLLLIQAGIFFVIGQLSWRFAGYIALFGGIPFAFGLWIAVKKISVVFGDKSLFSRKPQLLGIVIVLLFSVVGPVSSSEKSSDSSFTFNFSAVTDYFEKRLKSGEKSVVMGFPDLSPELMFRAEVGVLSIPNHRYQPGFEATYRVMHSLSDQEAFSLLKKFGVTHLVIVWDPSIKLFNGLLSNEDTLGKRLYDQRSVPDFLEKVSLPEAGTGYSIWIVK